MVPKALVFISIFSCFTIALSSVLRKPDIAKCGYESCHPLRQGYINVHIVPHTHDDVGWLKTVDQYYYGSRTNIQKAGVQYILDSVIDALKKDKNRRFIYVETAYLWKWWMKQHDIVKHQVRKLINNGQLEIIGGAWTMNDEATTHYQSIIDQFTWGLRKLNETFGKCGRPKIGWQIDPFGHSREMASIFAQLGYDGLLLGRIDYQDKRFRFDTKSAEFVWQGSNNLGNKSQLFTSIMYNTYSPPPGFCFDVLCADEPIIDDRKSPDYNVDKRVQNFFEYLNNVTRVYATRNVIITMGEDFNYQDAHMWFKNIDKLILYANQQQNNGSKYNLIYSTPSCYLKAVQDEGRNAIKWNVKTDDFFPYASDPNSYWTGYFTSRPTIKRFERTGNNFLQVCKQLYALTDLGPEDWVDLNVLREAMGVMQHHDAITGTEKEHVAYDYARILQKGFDECEFVSATALSNIVTGHKQIKTEENPAPEIPFQSCLLTNISQCIFTEGSSNFIVTVYNPLSRSVSQYVRLPVTGKSYKVTDPEGKLATVQLIPIADPIQNIPGRISKATAELIFIAGDIPPLGFKSYYIAQSEGDSLLKSTGAGKHSYGDVSIKVDETTGILYAVSMNGKNIDLTQQFYYYRGAVGNNYSPKNRSSGAYIFRPNGTDAIQVADTASYRLYNGPIVTELHQTFNNWVSQIIRIYRDEVLVEFDWLVGPIPTDDVNGKEIITKYTTSLNSQSVFYTDSNGREILKRVRDFRPTWKVNLVEPVAGNYYPVTSKILIRNPDDDVEIAVLTDRAQGGSSLKDGEIELMLHRSCLHDDAFGVGEALDEKAYSKGLVVRGSHYLVLGPYIHNTGKSIAAQERDIAQRKLLSAWTFLSPTDGLSYEAYKAKYNLQFAGLQHALPDNVQILTLEPWTGMSFLLRLEHVLEKMEDPVLSKPVVVNLKDLFTSFDIESYRETTLGANQWLDENERPKFQTGETMDEIVNKYEPHNLYEPIYILGHNNETAWKIGTNKWKQNQIETNDIHVKQYYEYKLNEDAIYRDSDFKVTLNPMQIRTFIIDIQKKSI